jgi:hypothetical protein
MYPHCPESPRPSLCRNVSRDACFHHKLHVQQVPSGLKFGHRHTSNDSAYANWSDEIAPTGRCIKSVVLISKDPKFSNANWPGTSIQGVDLLRAFVVGCRIIKEPSCKHVRPCCEVWSGLVTCVFYRYLIVLLGIVYAIAWPYENFLDAHGR